MFRYAVKRASVRRAIVTISVLFILLPGLTLFAGGQQEADHDEHDHGEEVHSEADHTDMEHHEEHENAIPHIDAVDLSDGRSLNVVATTNLIGDVVANIAGDAIDLTVLIPIGQNPHAYEPAPRAIAAIESADIVFVNGFDLEENLLSIVENTARAPIVPVSAGITPPDAEGDDEDHDDDQR